jgi:hypothetical protein
MKTQQQIDQAQDRSIDILKRKVNINERENEVLRYIERKYQATSPGLYGKELVESFQKLFNRNLSIWKTVLDNASSGYAYAYRKFGYVKQVEAQHLIAKQKMVDNIIGCYAAMGLGWFGPAVKVTVKNTLSRKKPQSVEDYFSSGFEEIVKKSGITFDGLPKVRYDSKKDLIQTTVNSVIKPTVAFKNDLDKSFDRCERKVTAQLDHMIHELWKNDSKTNTEILKQFGDFQADAQNPAIPLDRIYSNIDEACGTIKKMVRNMNAHLIDTAYYFRMKPGFNLDDQEVDQKFINIMAAFFERAMWAGWIPYHMKKNSWGHVPKVFYPKPRYVRAWTNDDHFRLKELKPGRYQNLRGHFDIQVTSDYHKPSQTLVDRLEVLQVIKTVDGGSVDKATLTRDQIKQVENLGWYVSDRDVKRLITWAEKECTKLSPYGMSGFPFVEREKNELWLPQLS